MDGKGRPNNGLIVTLCRTLNAWLGGFHAELIADAQLRSANMDEISNVLRMLIVTIDEVVWLLAVSWMCARCVSYS